MGERLCIIFNQFNPTALEEARSRYQSELSKSLEWEVEETFKYRKSVEKKSENFDLKDYTRTLHFFWRRVAGSNRVVESRQVGVHGCNER